jgi:hypothetical protein
MNLLSEALSCVKTAFSVFFTAILFIPGSILVIAILIASGWLIGRPINRHFHQLLEGKGESIPVVGPFLAIALFFIFVFVEDSKEAQRIRKDGGEMVPWRVLLAKAYFEAMLM